MRAWVILLCCCACLRGYAAAQFNGTSQYIKTDATLNLTGSPLLTIALWFNWTAYDTDSDTLISSTANPSTTAGSFQILPDSSTGNFLIVMRGNVGNTSATIPRPTAGVWHHLVIEYDMTQANLAEIAGVWVDGLAQNLTAVQQSDNTGNFANGDVYLASRAGTTLFGSCVIDNVSIWSGALLTTAEIHQVYEARSATEPISVQPAALKLSWRLNEAGTGSVFSGDVAILDQSGSGATGAPFNSPMGFDTVAFRPLQTTLAAGLSLSDFTTALANTLPGDTLLLPAGSNTWSSLPPLIGRSIVIRGAGTNTTIIKDAGNSASGGLIAFSSLAYPRRARIRDLTIYADTTLSSFAAIKVNGAPTNTGFQIDRIRFENQRKRAVWAQGLYGLIDRFYCDGPVNGTAQSIRVDGDLYNQIVRDTSDTTSSWQRPLDLGSTNYVYVQNGITDYTFANDGPGDSYFGGRRVDRDNLYINGTWGVHGCDSGYRSAHSYEFYRNRCVVTDASALVSAFIQLRGGTGVLWSNQLEALTYTFPGGRISLDCYRATGTNLFPFDSFPAGLITGTNNVDGNITNGWPGLDQVGMTSPTTFNPTNSVQTQAPLYQWANILISPAGTTNAVICHVDNVYTNVSPNAADMLVLNRDFYDAQHPSYTPLGDHPFTITTLDISPNPASVVTVTSQSLTGTGGSGIYVYWELLSDTSGGFINSTTGLYTAGASVGSAIVRVWDSNGDSAAGSIVITASGGGGEPVPAARRINAKIWKFLGL